MKQRILAAFLIACCLVASAAAKETISVAGYTMEPYLGEDLPGNGYVFEVLERAFANADYSLDFVFLPPKRAEIVAKNGRVAAIAPLHNDGDTAFVYSDPFPGDKIGLLVREADRSDYLSLPRDDLGAAFDSLKGKLIGTLLGQELGADFEKKAGKVFSVDTDPLNLSTLNKLALGRIDAALIDKHTAADIITKHAPKYIGKFFFVNPPLYERNFHVGFSRKDPNHQLYLDAFNEGLAKLKESGELLTIQNAHGLFPTIEQEDGTTKLRIGTVNNVDMKIMRELASEYQKQHPNVEFVWLETDESTLRKRLLGDFAVSDGQYDVMTIGSYETPIWASRGWLSPLLNIPESYDVNDVIPTVRSTLSASDTLFALPFYGESSMTFYRKDLFEKAGLKMPKAPTYADIKGFAEALHKPDERMYGICIRGQAGWGANMTTITTMVNTYGGRWFDMDWTPTLESSSWKQAVTMYKDLVRFAHEGTPDFNYLQNLELFSNGECSMWIDATVAAGSLLDPAFSKVHDSVGFAPAPIGTVDKGANWLWAWALAVPNSSFQTHAAKDFIFWATSKEYIELVGQTKGWLYAPSGTRISTYNSSQLKSVAPYSDFVLEQIQSTDPANSTVDDVPYTGVHYVSILEYHYLGNQVGNEIRKVITGETTPDAALSSAQEKAVNHISRAEY
jgi:ABC-type glycerol-3-phosphate transport system substrate-binding protein